MKKAFTLAEILISMAIIGVIATLMVPVMINSQKKSLETATIHFYSMMSQAIKQYMVDNDTETLISTPMYINNKSINWNNSNASQIENDMFEKAYVELDRFINEYLKVRKTCTNMSWGKENECFSTTISNLNEEVDNMQHTSNKAYVLDNGAVISVWPPRDYPMEIQVDVNGKKGPNIVGRDIWWMNIYKDGVISEKLHGIDLRYKNDPNFDKESEKKYIRDWLFEICDGTNGSSAWNYGAGCFARFEYNGFKFDY